MMDSRSNSPIFGGILRLLIKPLVDRISMRRCVVQDRITFVQMAKLVIDAAVAKSEPQAGAFALLVMVCCFDLG